MTLIKNSILPPNSVVRSAEVETGADFSLPSPDRFSASSQGWEAHAAVSSTPIEAQTLQLSDSEELDVVSANATQPGCGDHGRNWCLIESIVHKHHTIPLY